MRQSWIMSGIAGVASLSTVALTPISQADEVKVVNAQTRKELEAQEEQFGQAIEKRDSAALGKILADYYADSRGDEEKAAPKHLTIARAEAGRLVFYRIEKQAQFTAAGSDYYNVEGEAKSPSQKISDQPAKEEWVHVRRVWVKKDGHWLLVMQNIRSPKEDERSPKKK